MNRSGNEVRLHLLLRQPFASAEQDRGGQPGVIRPDERTHTLLGLLPKRIDHMRQRPRAARFDVRDAFRQRAAHAHESAIASRIGGEVELAGIQRGRDAGEPAEHAQVVASVNAEEVSFHGKLTGPARWLPIAGVANARYLDLETTSLANGDRSQRRGRWSDYTLGRLAGHRVQTNGLWFESRIPADFSTVEQEPVQLVPGRTRKRGSEHQDPGRRPVEPPAPCEQPQCKAARTRAPGKNEPIPATGWSVGARRKCPGSVAITNDAGRDRKRQHEKRLITTHAQIGTS